MFVRLGSIVSSRLALLALTTTPFFYPIILLLSPGLNWVSGVSFQVSGTKEYQVSDQFRNFRRERRASDWRGEA